MGQSDLPLCVYCDQHVCLSYAHGDVVSYYCSCGEKVDVTIGSDNGEELL